MTEHNPDNSPRILSVKWGKIEVENLGSGKDFKLWPGGGRSWNWAETGTRHSPGIQVGDCQELVDNGCRCIILSRGVFKRLKVTEEVLDYLEKQGIEVRVLETKKAVKEYNHMVEQGEKVGGLFHTTC